MNPSTLSETAARTVFQLRFSLRAKAFVTSLALTAASFAGRGDVIWTWQTTLGSQTAGNHTQEMVWFQGSGYNLFDSIRFGTNDVGRTFTISSPADDGGDFPTAVASLTNGRDDQIMIMNGPANMAGWTYTESTLFANVPRRGPDLTGYRIDAVRLTINQLSVRYPWPSFPWTEFAGNATLSIEGAIIPEPSVAALACVGLSFFAVLQVADKAQQRRKAIH
jgi:hypothetical protein